jgi:hypothetical protein
VLHLLGRALLIPLGVLLAALAALTLLMMASVVQPAIGGALTDAAMATLRAVFENLMADGEAPERIARLAIGLSKLTLAVLFLPVAIIAVATEMFSLRSWFVQALGVALLTALLPWAMLPSLLQGTAFASSLTGLLAATGAFAGSIYWMVAGHGAGRRPRSVEERATVIAPR